MSALPATLCPPDPDLAISYLRFSSPQQAEGDSVRRQTDARDDWLRRHPNVRLDTSLVLEDKGVSGFTGEHRTNRKHALASFLDLVQRGRVPAGTYLIVENLDRLTREEPEVSIPLVMNLISAGVRIVQLTPAEMVYEPGMDFGRLMMMLWELARGHGESKRKSGLCGEAWHMKKKAAREKRTPHGHNCPAWLELVGAKRDSKGRVVGGEYVEKPEAVKTVRLIFDWCIAGRGLNEILTRLNDQGITPIGRIGAWHRSYLHRILTKQTVLGVYQPRGRRKKSEGEPVERYYPAVVSEATWKRAQEALRARRGRSGRPPKAVANPFAGLLHCAVNGGKLHLTTSHGARHLVSQTVIQKRRGAKWRTFPLAVFTEAVLSQLRELQPADLFAGPGAARVTELTGALGEAERRLAVAATQWEAHPESELWQERVNRYEGEKRALVAELAEARHRAAHPLAAGWAEAVQLMARDDPTRLRAALLATVESIWCLFLPVKGRRLAAVQVWFKGEDGKQTGEHRDYLISYRRALGGAAGKYAPSWEVVSAHFEADTSVDILNLRDRAHARLLEQALKAAAEGLRGGGSS
jgi:DNA invertase Pin-like site-specific DNA recombinase